MTTLSLCRKWFTQTFKWLQKLLKQEVAPDIGLSMVSGYYLFDKQVEVRLNFLPSNFTFFNIYITRSNQRLEKCGLATCQMGHMTGF